MANHVKQAVVVHPDGSVKMEFSYGVHKASVRKLDVGRMYAKAIIARISADLAGVFENEGENMKTTLSQLAQGARLQWAAKGRRAETATTTAAKVPPRVYVPQSIEETGEDILREMDNNVPPPLLVMTKNGPRKVSRRVNWQAIPTTMEDDDE